MIGMTGGDHGGGIEALPGVRLRGLVPMYNHAPENYVCPFCLIVPGVENEHLYTVHTDVIYHKVSELAQ